MSRAHNWETFRDAVSHFRVPAQNFVFASTEGDIGYYLAGAIPIRQNTTGVLPHNGWESKGQWLGMVDFASQPHIFNPPERYIVTANNKIVDDKYPYYLSNQWEPQSRAARIHERLLSKDKLSIDDFKSMQLDHTSRHAQRLLPIVISEASAYLDTTPDQQIRDFRDLLKDWDGTESAESIAASIFHAFLVTLTENVLRDEMGSELFDAYISLGNAPTRVIAKLLEGGKSSWFDNIATPQVETKSDVVVKSLKDAQVLLEKLAGPEMGNWMWGSIHQLKMEHPLGKVRVFDPLFNIGPFKREGSAMTIDKSEYSYKEPFKSLVGASTRQIVDLSDIRHTLSVITSGQSGQVLSDHYSDQTPLWVEGEYHTMTLDSLEVVSSAVRHLTLLPEDGDN
jgi:penicillin amidase